MYLFIWINFVNKLGDFSVKYRYMRVYLFIAINTMFKYDVLHIVAHPIAINLQDKSCFLKYSSPNKTPNKK